MKEAMVSQFKYNFSRFKDKSNTTPWVKENSDTTLSGPTFKAASSRKGNLFS